MMCSRNLKSGDLVEVTWIDAVHYGNIGEMTEELIATGGEAVHTVGYLVSLSKVAVLLAGELDEKREPFRDANLIPRSLVKCIKRVKRGHFGE